MILVTGFEPFLKQTINPSQVVLQELKKERFMQNQWELVILPVSYQRSFEMISKEWETGKYRKILMLGQAGGRAKINLERVALNWCESSHSDDLGVIFNQVQIDSSNDVESAYFTNIDLNEIKKSIENNSIPVEVSLSAGGYVCNFLYFKTLKNLTLESLFVHLPYLPEQLNNEKERIPTMDLCFQKQAIRLVLSELVKVRH